MVWTVPANGGESIVETYGFRTDILPGYDASEQRVRLRSLALESLEFAIEAQEAREAQLATSTIFAGQHEVIVLPWWQYGSRLMGAVGIGDQLLPIGDAQDVPYRVGGDAVVWRDPFTWELFEVDSVSGAGVATVDLATIAWASGSALVYPARRVRLPDKVALSRITSRVLSGRVRYTAET